MPAPPSTRSAPRRLAVVLLLLVLAGCAGGAADGDQATEATAASDVPDATEAPDAPEASEASDPTEGAGPAYPVTVPHRFGETEVAEEPERIVALGYTELDYVLALGHVPVAARYPQFGDTETAVRQWAEEAAGDADIRVLNYQFGEIDYEEVAALDPDLILGVTSGVLQDEYDQLSAIAPTIAQSGDYVDFGMPWQEITRTIGLALGETSRAEELVSDVEAQFAAAQEANPAFEGRTVASAFYGVGEVLVFAAEDLRASFFVDLGMEVPAAVDELAGDLFYGSLSLEQLDLIDTDVLVWSQLQFTDGGRGAIDSDPLVQQLAVVEEGRTLYLDGLADDALQVSTILSLPTALEEIVPQLAAATDDDPATVPG